MIVAVPPELVSRPIASDTPGDADPLIQKFAKELGTPIQRRALYMGQLVEQEKQEKVAAVGKKTKRP